MGKAEKLETGVFSGFLSDLPQIPSSSINPLAFLLKFWQTVLRHKYKFDFLL